MSELVQVKIKGLITTSRYGAMSSGDLLRTDAAYARHLVEELKVAEYVTAPAKPADKPAEGGGKGKAPKQGATQNYRRQQATE